MFEWAKNLSANGVVYVENDLRAFANPTRMENIRRATQNLVQKCNPYAHNVKPLGFGSKIFDEVFPAMPVAFPPIKK